MHVTTQNSHGNDQVMAALVAGLEVEFGRGAGEGLAQHFLAAEDADFRWQCRIEERWIGAYAGDDEDGITLDRIAICGSIDGDWFQALMIVDGDGNAHGMLGCRAFETRDAARKAMAETR